MIDKKKHFSIKDIEIWLQRKLMDFPILTTIFSIAGLTIIYIFVQHFVFGNTAWADWTGFREYTGSIAKEDRGKTLWDVLELVIIPVGGALIAYFFNKSLKENEQRLIDERVKIEREILIDQQREIALQSYMMTMHNLIEKNDPCHSLPGDEIRNFVTTITQSTLNKLDGKRKGLVIKFLYGANFLYRKDPIVSLEYSDLSDIDLSNTDLESINFKLATLKNANFYQTKLKNASFEKVFLDSTKFYSTNLNNADFSYAYGENVIFDLAVLSNANLENSYFPKASFDSADLTDANFEYAYLKSTRYFWSELTNTNFRSAILLEADFLNSYEKNTNFEYARLNNAIMPDGKKYDPGIHTVEYLTSKK